MRADTTIEFVLDNPQPKLAQKYTYQHLSSCDWCAKQHGHGFMSLVFKAQTCNACPSSSPGFTGVVGTFSPLQAQSMRAMRRPIATKPQLVKAGLLRKGFSAGHLKVGSISPEAGRMTWEVKIRRRFWHPKRQHKAAPGSKTAHLFDNNTPNGCGPCETWGVCQTLTARSAPLSVSCHQAEPLPWVVWFCCGVAERSMLPCAAMHW